MDSRGVHRSQRQQNGADLARLRAQQELALRAPEIEKSMLQAQHLAMAQQNLAQLQQARQAYIGQLQNAIVGKPSGLFQHRALAPRQVFNAVTSNVSSPIHQMGVSNQPAQTPEQKMMQDQLGAQLFRFPDTDPLSYHRRIEHPQVFRASPVFGF